MKIKNIVDDKVMIEWYDFATMKEVGGIYVHERVVKDVRGNEGNVLMIGNNVNKVRVGDKVFYAANGPYKPFETDSHGKVIIIPQDDIIMILENDNV